MRRRPGPQPYGSHFAPLVAYLVTCEEETITLPLTQIETIIGRPLAVTATVSPSYWTSARDRHSRDLHACGWRAHLMVRERAVEFRRIDPMLAEE